MGTSEILAFIFGSGGVAILIRDLVKAYFEWSSGKPQKRRDLIGLLSKENDNLQVAKNAWQTGFYDLYNLAHKCGAKTLELKEIEERVTERIHSD